MVVIAHFVYLLRRTLLRGHWLTLPCVVV